MPKSSTLSCPERVRKMFAGLMSRWMTPFACAAASTSRSWSATDSTSSSLSCPPLRTRRSSSVSPSSSSVTRNSDPSSATSSSDHLDGTVVGDGVRGVALAHEAGAHVGAGRKLGVQHLDGHAAAVAVCRGVDGGHPAHAEQHVEPPLACGASGRCAGATAGRAGRAAGSEVVVVFRCCHVPPTCAGRAAVVLSVGLMSPGTQRSRAVLCGRGLRNDHPRPTTGARRCGRNPGSFEHLNARSGHLALAFGGCG